MEHLQVGKWLNWNIIIWQEKYWQVLEYADKPDYAMILGIFERTMKRRGVRESDPLDWEKAGSDSTQSEGLGTAIKNSVPQNNKVIVPDNAENATVDNQENVEPDNMKEVSLIPTCFLTLDILHCKVQIEGEDGGTGAEETKSQGFPDSRGDGNSEHNRGQEQSCDWQ